MVMPMADKVVSNFITHAIIILLMILLALHVCNLHHL